MERITRMCAVSARKMRAIVRVFLLAIALGCCGIQGQVISEPDDVTICEEREAVFTCVLNSSIKSDDVQWYRFIKDNSTTVMVDPDEDNINFITNTNGNATNISLTITNVIESYTGYFWVGTSSLNVCNASLTVLTRPSGISLNITKNIENSSAYLQWDTMDDSLQTTYYTLTLSRTGDRLQTANLVDQTSYTITGLALDTTYTVTIHAANLCGRGPDSSATVSFSTVISEPDDVTICEEKEAVFTCVLNSNIRSDDVQWYRFIKDNSTTVMVDPNGGNINLITNTNGNTTSSSLTITNVIKSLTGYFWVGTSSLNVCNASLTVLTRPSGISLNITKNIENSSVYLQWDTMNDTLQTTYYTLTLSITEDNSQPVNLVDQTSYTITGLDLDTVYTIAIRAANTCGQGPRFSSSIILSTNTTSTTSSISPIVTVSTNSTSISPTVSASTNSMNISTTNPSSTIVTTISNPSITTTIIKTTFIDTFITAITTTTFVTSPSTPSTTATISATTSGATTIATTTTTTTTLIAIATIAITTTTSVTSPSTPSTTTTKFPTIATTTTAIALITVATTGVANTATTATTAVSASTPSIATSGIVSPTSAANPADATSADATSADEGSGSSVFIIVGVILAGIILVSLFFILFCFFGRKRGKLFNRKDYDSLKGNGTLRNNIPMVPSSLDSKDNEKTNYNQPEGTGMNSQPLDPPCTYDRLESVEKLHTPGIYDQLGVAQQPLRSYAQYDKLPKARRADVISEALSDDGIPSGVPTVTVPDIDANQKNDEPSVHGTHKDTGDGVHSNVPTVADQTGGTTNQNPYDPALHYAVLQTLPTPTGAYMTTDDTFTPYALVTQN